MMEGVSALVIAVVALVATQAIALLVLSLVVFRKEGSAGVTKVLRAWPTITPIFVGRLPKILKGDGS